MKINDVVNEGRKKVGKGKYRNPSTGTPQVATPAEKQAEIQQDTAARRAQQPNDAAVWKSNRAPFLPAQTAPADAAQAAQQYSKDIKDKQAANLAQRDQTTATTQVDQPVVNKTMAEPKAQPAQQSQEPQQPTQPTPQQQTAQRPSLWNRIKGGMQNFSQNRANAAQQQKGQELAARFSKRWLDQWNQNVGADPSIAQDPAELQQFMQRAFADKLKANEIPAPTDMSPRGVAQYIRQMSGKYISGKSTPDVRIDPEIQKIKNKARADAIYQGELEKLKAGQQAYSDKTARQAAQNLKGTIPGLKPDAIAQAFKAKGGLEQLKAPQEPEVLQQMMPGVKIVSKEPIIIDFENRRYGLNDQGKWMHLASGKVPPQAIQALLSQQHDISLK